MIIMIIPPTKAVATKASLNDVTTSFASRFIPVALATSTAPLQILDYMS